MTTVKLHFSINNIFVGQDNEDNEDESFTCPICCESYYKKKILQCKEGCMYCLECWSKSLSLKSECMSCRCKVNSIDDLSRNRYLEKNLLNIKCHCPYSFKNILDCTDDCKLVKDLVDGCTEVVKLDQLESHMKQCKFKFVKCENDGCNSIHRLKRYDLHYIVECKYKMVPCGHCGLKVSNISLEKHQNECSEAWVVCPQCASLVKRYQLEDHIKNQCQDTILDCKYSMFGCKSTFKRSQLIKHFNQIDHTLYMNELMEFQENQLKSLKLELLDCKKQLNQSNEYIIGTMCLNNDFSQHFNKKFNINWTIPMFSSKIKNNDLSLSNELVKFIEIGLCRFELSMRSSNQELGYLSIILKDQRTLSPFNYSYSFILINKKDISNNLKLDLLKTSEFVHQYLNFINLIDILMKENGWLSNETIDNKEYDDCLEIEFIIEIKSNPSYKSFNN